MYRMKSTTRRHFIAGISISAMWMPISGHLFGNNKNSRDRFQVGIQEYTFNRWLKSGRLNHLDYPALVNQKEINRSTFIKHGLTVLNNLAALPSG
jgi:hypothetical protein